MWPVAQLNANASKLLIYFRGNSLVMTDEMRIATGGRSGTHQIDKNGKTDSARSAERIFFIGILFLVRDRRRLVKLVAHINH